MQGSRDLSVRHLVPYFTLNMKARAKAPNPMCELNKPPLE